MNIRQVEIFKAIMDNGSITNAAKRLHISQPSVSKHLKHLEGDLGLALFERRGKRLVPVPEAHALFDQVSRLYLGMEHVSGFAQRLKHRRPGQVAVAAVPIVAWHWLPDAVSRFLAQYEDVSISLPVRSSQWIADWVSSARVDFGVGLSCSDTSSTECQLLTKLPLVLVIPHGHAMQSRPSVRWQSLTEENLITLSNYDGWKFVVQRALEAHHVHPRRCVDTFSPRIACELVLRGAGIAVVDGLTALDHAGSGLRVCRLEPQVCIEVYLLKPKRKPLSMLAKGLSQEIVDCSRETEERLRSSRLLKMPPRRAR